MARGTTKPFRDQRLRAPADTEAPPQWQLVTAIVGFRRSGSGLRLSETQLDALAGILIEIEEVVTVLVHPEGETVVYRVDVCAATSDEAARLATLPTAEVERQLDLVASVHGVHVGGRPGSLPG